MLPLAHQSFLRNHPACGHVGERRAMHSSSWTSCLSHSGSTETVFASRSLPVSLQRGKIINVRAGARSRQDPSQGSTGIAQPSPSGTVNIGLGAKELLSGCDSLIFRDWSLFPPHAHGATGGVMIRTKDILKSRIVDHSSRSTARSKG